MAQVKLGDYRTPGVGVLAGRERGRNVRAAARLDELDTQQEPITVLVAEDIFSVNSSFFLGMFAESIRKLGEPEFRKRYRFEGKDISRTVEDGIREALQSKSPL